MKVLTLTRHPMRWRLAMHLLRSEWRAGDLRMVFTALLLAVTVVAGLSAFTSRLQLMLGGEAAQMLAADRVLESPQPINPAWPAWAAQAGARHSRFLEFQSMLFAPGQAPLLVSAKAADSAYPLLGAVQSRSSPSAAVRSQPAQPAPGEVWLEARALQQLGLQVGNTVELGDGQFRISAVLVAEPDRAAGFSGLGPRLLMHWQDIEKTGVVQVGSRLTYRYLFSGNATVLAQLDAHFKPLLADNQRWLDIHNAQPRMGSALDKAQQFLLLASSMVVILAGIAIALSAARFAQRQMRMVAILKTLGASSRDIQGIYGRALGMLGAVAALLGCIFAWALQHLAIAQAQGDLQMPPPPLSAWPFALGLLSAAISLPAAYVLRRLRQPQLRLHGAWALALSNLQRRLFSNAVHIALFATSAMLLLVLWGLQHQIFSQWQAQLPPRTPNFFVVNLPEASVPAAHQWLQQRGLGEQGLYPMVRARLTHINSQPVRQRVSKEDADQASLNRELNLSWAEDLPAHNKIQTGQWWTPANRAHGVSVESKLAERLKLRLGDELEFLQGSLRFKARVTSLREVDWNRMEPTFYMLFTPEQLWDYPKTYITSFYLPPTQQAEISALAQAFPQAVILDLQAVIGQIRSIMTRVALALQLVLGLVLLGSLLVLLSTVQHSLAERQHETAVLRALGASRRLLQGALWLEFAIMGAIAGLLASVFAQIVLLALQRWVFELPLALTPQLWWPAPILGAILIGAAGYVSAHSASRAAPMRLLRQAD